MYNADDRKLIAPRSNATNANHIPNYINSIFKWANTWLNRKKCKVIQYRSNNTTKPYTMPGKNISEQTVILSWKLH